ncbi:MAG: hypothetical protein BGO78_15700 [Chloroflexi bacterium 44-23]|nr:MAG: hypothetical protein BGO78_15700 [Chloroflexi bacterium 44-23]
MKSKPTWRLRPAERKIILVVGDIVSATLALLIALILWSIEPEEWLRFSWQFIIERPPIWYFFLPVLWVVLLLGLYDNRHAEKISSTISGIAMSALLSAIIYFFIFFLAAPNSLPRLGVALFFIGSTVLTLIWRLIYIAVFSAPAFLRRVIIVGAGNSGSTLVNIVKKSYPIPFHLVGLIDDDPSKRNTEFMGYEVIGSSDELLRIIDDEQISDVVFAISGNFSTSLLNAVITAEENGVDVTTMPVMYEELLGRIPIYLVQNDWLLRSFVDQMHINRFYEFGKRLIDIIGGLVGVFVLVILSPFIIFGIAISGKGPIIYRQTRMGKNGKEFKIIKFRSMQVDAEKNGLALAARENDDRITPFGRFLRKSHLDELPQFINILKGDMSLVGPRSERPMIIDELKEIIPFYRARLFVKPGLTGWAQVNFGYASTIEENAIKLEYDLYYIKHRNTLMDLGILFQTVGSVIGLRGR